MRRRNKKIAEIFKKEIPHIIEIKTKEGISFGYYRGTLNGLILGAGFALVISSFYFRESSDIYFLLPMAIMAITVFLSKFTLPREIKSEINGKLLLLYAAAIMIVLYILLFVI